MFLSIILKEHMPWRHMESKEDFVDVQTVPGSNCRIHNVTSIENFRMEQVRITS